MTGREHSVSLSSILKKTLGSYETIVIGGGLAGICAAIASARLGCRTALIHNRPVLGGNSSSEIRVPIAGAPYSGKNKYSVETGIIEELRIENSYRNPNMSYPLWDSILWEWVKRESNIELFLNTWARKPIMDGTHIGRVIAEQMFTEKEFSLEGDIFIDCSGDGKIAAAAGADFRIGREAGYEYGESKAPDIADSYVLPSSIQFQAKDTGKIVPFNPPSWAMDFPKCEDIPFHTKVRAGQSCFWWIEWGGRDNTIQDNEKIRDELLKIVFGVWDHYKNHGDHGVANYELEWVGWVPGKRESRRFLGDYILTQNDIQAREYFSGAVAYGGWCIDLHPPEGPFTKDSENYKYAFLRPYNIPFRCLYSRNIDNLMMAGRNISVTHVALGSTRIQATCALLGQAVGTAAALCTKYKVTPRKIYKRHIKELQQSLLKQDCYIIGIRNEDPRDFARSASIRASSEQKLTVTKVDGFYPLDIARAELFPVSEPQIDTITLLLRSTRDREVKVQLTLQEADIFKEFGEDGDIASAWGTVPPGTTWVEFSLNCKVIPGRVYWIWLPATQGISWAYSKEDFEATRRAYEGCGPGDMISGTHCFQASPSLRVYSCKNVVNGIAHPENWPNLWISDSSKGFPQWIELKFGKIERINAIYLIFDTNLNRPVGQRQSISGPIPECIRDYSIAYRERGVWKKILEKKGNHHRHRKHFFPTVQAEGLRIEIIATNGDPSARIYEIRAYHEKP